MAALVYDLLAALAIVMVVGLLLQVATRGQLIAVHGRVVIPPWYRPLQAVVIAAYFTASWRYGGQTLGMRPWRIQLRSVDGRAPSWLQALCRIIVASAPVGLLWLAPTLGVRMTLWAMLLAWVAWFAPALLDRRRRALHDLLAGTELRRIW